MMDFLPKVLNSLSRSIELNSSCKQASFKETRIVLIILSSIEESTIYSAKDLLSIRYGNYPINLLYTNQLW